MLYPISNSLKVEKTATKKIIYCSFTGIAAGSSETLEFPLDSITRCYLSYFKLYSLSDKCTVNVYGDITQTGVYPNYSTSLFYKDYIDKLIYDVNLNTFYFNKAVPSVDKIYIDFKNDALVSSGNIYVEMCITF